MCGITGSVGRPKNSILAYNLHTNLLRETKRRGHHATGFYAVNLDGEAMFDKAPVSAEAYIKRPEWKQLINGSIAMIGHARFTTNGAAHINDNNHPHVNKSGNMALVHNGIIYNYEQVKNEYSNVLKSECDSEIILRIIAREKTPLKGIKKVYELLGSGGDFACELIHTNKNTNKTTFYFFRDEGRPGIMIDAKKELGQIIFCSEIDIWVDAALKSGMPAEIRNLPVQEIPAYSIMAIDAKSLKTKITKVDKPIFRSKLKTYRSPVLYNDYSDYFKKYPDSNFRSQPTFKPSVLKEPWRENINPINGFPRFTYEPTENNKPIVSKVQEEEFKNILINCISDKSNRYPGWQDDACTYNLITEEEWLSYSEEDESEDFLDYLTLQENDDEFLNSYINLN